MWETFHGQPSIVFGFFGFGAIFFKASSNASSPSATLRRRVRLPQTSRADPDALSVRGGDASA